MKQYKSKEDIESRLVNLNMQLENILDDLEVYEKLQRQKMSLELEIKELESLYRYFDEPACDKDYYEIRLGECKHAEIIGGKVQCKNPRCKEY
jgi:hypothetical protein